MLRFRHFPPQPEDWKQARLGQALDLPARPEPVDDFQAYNAIHHQGHWVGDLAVACRDRVKEKYPKAEEWLDFFYDILPRQEEEEQEE